MGESTRTIIDLCYDEEKIERLLLSDISKPTEMAPVALISNDIVFQTVSTESGLRYYKIP